MHEHMGHVRVYDNIDGQTVMSMMILKLWTVDNEYMPKITFIIVHLDRQFMSKITFDVNLTL